MGLTWNFNILLACEKKFNFRFSNQEFSSINSFKEILKVVKKKIFKDKIENLFKNLKISRGDNILVHSNTAGIHQFLDDKKEKNLKFFIDLVLDIIGKKEHYLSLHIIMILLEVRLLTEKNHLHRLAN